MISAGQRRQQILKKIKNEGMVLVEEQAVQYGVSLVTIRSDLNIIESENIMVKRCHGGAFLIESGDFTKEIAINEKKTINVDVKQKLAEVAATLISDGDSVIFDSGSTIEYLAREIKEKKDVVVLTNSINVAYELTKNPSGEVIILGGHVNKQGGSVVTMQPKQFIQDYRFNMFFLGADGFDLELGITTHRDQEAKINREMCKVSNKIVVVADSTKFNKRSHCAICSVADINVLVTDSGIDNDLKKSIEKLGVKVIVV